MGVRTDHIGVRISNFRLNEKFLRIVFESFSTNLKNYHFKQQNVGINGFLQKIDVQIGYWSLDYTYKNTDSPLRYLKTTRSQDRHLLLCTGRFCPFGTDIVGISMYYNHQL